MATVIGICSRRGFPPVRARGLLACALASDRARCGSRVQIPIKSAIAQNFGVFNKLYTAVPSASSPNHLFTQSATSCGMQHNGLYNDCLGPTVMFPQFTIYDNMRLHNVSLETPSRAAMDPPLMWISHGSPNPLHNAGELRDLPQLHVRARRHTLPR